MKIKIVGALLVTLLFVGISNKSYAWGRGCWHGGGYYHARVGWCAPHIAVRVPAPVVVVGGGYGYGGGYYCHPRPYAYAPVYRGYYGPHYYRGYCGPRGYRGGCYHR